MPSGGLMQLVSYGSEDLYLTGNPQITFFKVVYKRHTNFAYEWIPIYFNPTLSWSTTESVQMSGPIPRQGDLIRDMALVIDLPAIYSNSDENFKWVKNLGQVLLNNATITVAGQTINKEYGQWLNIWSELTIPEDHRPAYNELIGNTPDMYNPLFHYGDIGTGVFPTIKKRRLRIPLPFWFTQHPGLALPLIAIQYVAVEIGIDLRPLNDLFTIGIPAVSPSQLWDDPSTAPGSNHIALRQTLTEQGYGPSNIFWKFVNGMNAPGRWNQNIFVDTKYVFLDNAERRLFAAAVSEYLITQVERLEFTGLLGGPNTVDIDFYHPVKEMVWIFQRDDVSDRNQWTNYTTLANTDDMPRFLDLLNSYRNAEDLQLTPQPIDNVLLPSGLTVSEFIAQINCTDQLKQYRNDMDVFDQVYNIMYNGEFIFNGHKRQEPKTNFYYQYQEPLNAHTSTPSIDKQIYVFSFAEKPEMIQPSGSSNFTRYHNPEFQFTIKSQLPVGECITDNERYNLYFYVRQINIVRIMNGIMGLVWAN